MKRLLFRAAAMIPSAAALAFAVPAFAAPSIGSVTPVTAAAGVPVTLSAAVSSPVPIQSCQLYVDLNEVGEMTIAYGVASRSYTFPYGGSRIAFVFCRDTSGGIAAGPNTSIWVTGPLQSQPPLGGEQAPPPTAEPTIEVPTDTSRRLVKLACPEESADDHPCRAVYYVGADGRRHAFPNSRVFFTWYENFDDVVAVTAEELAAIPLGQNVRYRPGVRMVKFTTDPKVYAVAGGGVLRWITTEEIARALYGDDWNAKIDDIPDTFYTDYAFGNEVASMDEYDIAIELQENASID